VIEWSPTTACERLAIFSAVHDWDDDVASHCNVYIGTSGWHYQHWRGVFYPPELPARDMLLSYGKWFDTVEINNTFYRLPSQQTFTDWHHATQAEFCFSVKASRYITHHKKLKDVEPALERFMQLVDSLGSKLGPILFRPPIGTRSNFAMPVGMMRASIRHCAGTTRPSACMNWMDSSLRMKSPPILPMSGFTVPAGSIKENILCTP